MSGPTRRISGRSRSCTLRCRRALPGIQHAMQVRDRVFDVVVLVLAGAAFCREHATAVDLAEIPIGKFVVSLGLLGFFVIDSQIPPAVFGKAVEANEFIFLLGSRPVLAPCISLVQYNPSFVDKLLGMLKCPAV
jgi:hypothetical protein